MRAARRGVFIVAVAIVLFLAPFCAEASSRTRVTVSVTFGGAVVAGAALIAWSFSAAYSSADSGGKGEDRVAVTGVSSAYVQTKKDTDGIEVRLVNIKF